jgi:hypothetical protein
VFGSDGYVGGEGWYIDDVKIVGLGTSNDDNILNIGKLQLFENYPNPFNPTTTLRFNLPAATNASLQVFNIKGQLVNTLVNGTLDSGTHSVVWNGTDSSNRSVASGVYYFRLSTPMGTQSKKMLLMK